MDTIYWRNHYQRQYYQNNQTIYFILLSNSINYMFASYFDHWQMLDVQGMQIVSNHNLYQSRIMNSVHLFLIYMKSYRFICVVDVNMLNSGICDKIIKRLNGYYVTNVFRSMIQVLVSSIKHRTFNKLSPFSFIICRYVSCFKRNKDTNILGAKLWRFRLICQIPSSSNKETLPFDSNSYQRRPKTYICICIPKGSIRQGPILCNRCYSTTSS